MTLISWNESIPSNASAVGHFPPYARSVWTAISQGLAPSLQWNASGGASDISTGDLAFGGSRAFYDVRSRSSAPNSQMTARLFVTSDTFRTFVYESNDTYMAFTPYLIEHGGFNGGTDAQRLRQWIVQSGTTTAIWPTDSSLVTIPYTTPFLPPSFDVVIRSSNTFFATPVIFDNSGATNFIITMRWLGTIEASLATLMWRAVGSVAVGTF